MNIRRKFEGLLAEGRGIQLFWVFCFIGLFAFLFLGLSKVLFGPDAFCWQDIIALFLDPGVFAGHGSHDIFRLIITLVGLFLFAAVLISIVSNIFENITDSYKKGESRYNFRNHILFIGSNKIIFGMLKAISDNQQYKKQHIVIMTCRQVEAFRDEAAAYLDDKKFLKRVTFYYDKRDNLENLKRACADTADSIYVIGEDSEPNHDLINLSCLRLLRQIGLKPTADCFVMMESQSSMKAYYAFGYNIIDNNIKTNYAYNKDRKVKNNEYVFNLNECKAEVLLKNTTERFDSLFFDNSVIFITIIGMTSISRALATTIAYSFHFGGNHKTVITIIDKELKEKRQEFQTRYKTLLHNCECYYNEYNIENIIQKCTISDISWNFLEESSASDNIFNYLVSIQKKEDSREGIGATFICYEDIFKNLATVISIRDRIDGISIYADFDEYDNTLSSESQDSSIGHSSYGFDFKIENSFKYIFEDRIKSGQEYYERIHGKGTWNALAFPDKQRSIYEAFATKLWSNKARITPCQEKYNSFAKYLLGISDNEDGSSVYKYENQHFFTAIEKHLIWSGWEEEDYGSNRCDGPRFWYVDDKNWTKDDCLKIQSLYIESLNNGKERDLAEFLRFEITDTAKNENLFVLSEDLFKAILSFTSEHDISIDCIDALYELIIYYLNNTSPLVYIVAGKVDLTVLFKITETAEAERLDNSSKEILLSINSFISEYHIKFNDYKELHKHIRCILNNTPVLIKSFKILHKLAENGNHYACLAISKTYSNDYKNRLLWYKKAIEDGNITVPDNYFNNIPNVSMYWNFSSDFLRFFSKITEDVATDLYVDTKSEYCLDWIIKKNITKDCERDNISIIENKVESLTNLHDEELYLRIALASDSNPDFQAMWLEKARKIAESTNNFEVLHECYLKLGDYFKARDECVSVDQYYKKAFQIKINYLMGIPEDIKLNLISILEDREKTELIDYRSLDEDPNEIIEPLLY